MQQNQFSEKIPYGGFPKSGHIFVLSDTIVGMQVYALFTFSIVFKVVMDPTNHTISSFARIFSFLDQIEDLFVIYIITDSKKATLPSCLEVLRSCLLGIMNLLCKIV